MTHEFSVQLLESVYGLVGKRVETCSGKSFEGSREHVAFGGVSCIVEIQRGLEAKHVIIGVSQLVIPLLRDIQAEEDCLLLDYKG